jgi:RHS repeat-associated protein
MSSTTDSLGNTTIFSYDSRNNLVQQVDPLGNAKRFEYDVYAHKVTEIYEMTDTGLGGGTPSAPAITRFEYDKNGSVTAYVDAQGNRTEVDFDALDRRITVRYPDSTTQEFQYDADDHVILSKDNNGLKRQYSFDALDRMIRMDLDTSVLATGITVEGATFEEFQYDGLRRVKLEQNDFATTERKVDSLGRCYEETINFHINTPAITLVRAYMIQRQFDAMGNLFQIIYPGGRVLRYDLDDLNRIQRIENVTKGTDYPGSTTFPENYEILRNEYRGLRKTKAIFGNNASTSYAFDGNGRIIQIAHEAAGDSLTIQHLYDAAGNMRIKNDVTPRGNRGASYKYNSLYWLTKVEERAIQPFNPLDFEPASVPLPADMLHGQTQIDALIQPLAQDPADFTFQYDLAGNREEEREPGQPPVPYVSNNLNQYSSVAGAGLSYDPNGNLTNDGLRQYFYDYRNLLVRVHDPAVTQDAARFFHDARGRRIFSSTATQATHFIFDERNVIEEHQEGTLVAQYVNEYGLDTVCQIAVRENGTVQGNEHWYHKDLVRSSRHLTDKSGTISATYRYSPFGLLIEEMGPYNPYKFMGRRLDDSVNAYDFRSREYSLELGRFLQRDVVTAPNLYMFVQNNPLIAIDPTGRERQTLSLDPSLPRMDSSLQLDASLNSLFGSDFSGGLTYTSRTEEPKLTFGTTLPFRVPLPWLGTATWHGLGLSGLASAGISSSPDTLNLRLLGSTFTSLDATSEWKPSGSSSYNLSLDWFLAVNTPLTSKQSGALPKFRAGALGVLAIDMLRTDILQAHFKLKLSGTLGSQGPVYQGVYGGSYGLHIGPYIPLGGFHGSFEGSGTEISRYSVHNYGITEFRGFSDAPQKEYDFFHYKSNPHSAEELFQGRTPRESQYKAVIDPDDFYSRFIGAGYRYQQEYTRGSFAFELGFGFGLTDQNLPTLRLPVLRLTLTFPGL